MSLSDLFRKSKKLAALKKAAVASTVVAGVAGFSMLTKSVDSSGNVVQSSSSGSSSAGSSGAAGFASSNPVIKPPPSSSTGGSSEDRGISNSNFNPEKCMKNPTLENCTDNGLSQSDWDQFLPTDGLVVRDGRGNVVFKKCRSLTEGQATAKKEMEQEKARFDKFTTAMNVIAPVYYGGADSGYSGSHCNVQPTKVAPKEAPCPNYQNYTDLKNHYREQYYVMSNELQKKAADKSIEIYDCGSVRDNVMAAVDPNWKNDRSIASEQKSANAASGNRGIR